MNNNITAKIEVTRLSKNKAKIIVYLPCDPTSNNLHSLLVNESYYLCDMPLHEEWGEKDRLSKTRYAIKTIRMGLCAQVSLDENIETFLRKTEETLREVKMYSQPQRTHWINL